MKIVDDPGRLRATDAGAQRPSEALDGCSQETLARALAALFRGSDDGGFADLVGRLFEGTAGPQRAGLLNMLLVAASPGAAAAVGTALGRPSGAGADVAALAAVTPDEAQRLPARALRILAAHAAANDPAVVDRAGDFFAARPETLSGLGSEAVAALLAHVEIETLH